ncbi:hypothetical protein CE557_849 [Cardinium endosymbiont of Sogatella furcifera]|uniref:SMI1/KNR4 family protein n=1 Tax=Cardinium endosymbiont of Sogatella furcifera TaxID=650378 RepID=UPI000E10E3C8|nr:SMI1/KNR4 family protein [Cardinium endosymbiont of Sogatella furcifera]AXI24633.1 hypothetical protein CE557_849 [Cardinium endosymbiont of Sogatella furcifera]
MKTRLLYTLNLFACTGIGACNGMNMNRMDNKKPVKQEIKKEPGESSKSGKVSSERQIRVNVVGQINNKIKIELGYEFPDGYKSFLLEYDPSRLESLGLGYPFRIFSFETPQSEEMIQPVAQREVDRYMDMYCSFPRSSDAIEQVNVPLCIAAHSEAHNYKDGDEDEAMVYYYIDLQPTQHKERPLKIYRVLRNNTVESIRTSNMVDFIEYCKRENKGIKESEEDMVRRKKK